MKEKLIELDACAEALEWAGDKTWEEIYNTCHRGDWLLWLFAKTNPDDFRLLTLVKAHCANTVRHSAYTAARVAAEAAGAYAASYHAAKKENQKLTADVCRKYLPIEIWNV
jgi:hypothetical protein